MSIKVRNACRWLKVQPAEKAALMAMADYARDDGSRVYPSLDTLELETCFSNKTLRRAIEGLERLAVLVPKGNNKGGRNTSNRYDIDLNRVAALMAEQAPACPDDAAEPADAEDLNPVIMTTLPEPAELENPVILTVNPVTVSLNPVTMTDYPLRTVRTEERELQATLYCATGPRQRGWSRKVNHPDQLELEDAIAARVAADQLAAEPISCAAPVMDQPAASVVVTLEAEPISCPAPIVGQPVGRGAVVLAFEKPKGSRCKATGDAGFDEFYAAYPRHKDPEHAKGAYLAALRRPGVTHAVIMQGVADYRAEIERDGTAMQYVKHPKTWLNAGSYLNRADPNEGVTNYGQRNQRYGGGGNICSRISLYGTAEIPD